MSNVHQFLLILSLPHQELQQAKCRRFVHKNPFVHQGSIAYVPQQAWIQNATVRDNILFGKPFNRKKYERTLEACELERDLTILSAGDMTEIGEKVSLAGIASFGVRERVSDTARPHLQ